MNRKKFSIFVLLIVFVSVGIAIAQPPSGPGGPSAPDMLIVEKFDLDKDGFLNAEEREQALVFVKEQSSGQRRRGPRGGRGRTEPGKPGISLSPADVENYPDAELYDRSVLRTLFLEFDNEEWEKELAAFKPTDVEIPAKLTVDAKEYSNVGVSFRGASSFFMIPEGLKRSLNLSIDFIEKDQRLYGYKSLNLLNCNGDAAMMSSALYSHLSGQHIPTPKVNFVRVVINGENWGIYTSSQQFNKVFVAEHFDTKKGARWKVTGSPRGDGGLRYLGEDIEPYRERFEIKSKDKDKSWRDLVNLCKVLNETPSDQLVEALKPILNIDGALWFLAMDVVTVNSDGYWTRASDYNIYQDPDGVFHILPHDMNEAFRAGGGRGGPGGGPGGPGGAFGGGPPPPEAGGGPPPPEAGGNGPPEQRRRRGGGGGPGGGGGHGGTDLDPLIGLDEDRKPLRSKLLNIPELQTKYLENVRSIAQSLKWEEIGPLVKQMKELIEEDVEKDTRKLTTNAAFQAATSDEKPDEDSTGLRAFSEKRTSFLLNHKAIKSLPDSSK